MMSRLVSFLPSGGVRVTAWMICPAMASSWWATSHLPTLGFQLSPRELLLVQILTATIILVLGISSVLILVLRKLNKVTLEIKNLKNRLAFTSVPNNPRSELQKLADPDNLFR